MRLLILCKRRPQGKDLLERPYGRFFYLPYYLARQGHHVTILLLSYQTDEPQHYFADEIEWISESVFPLRVKGGLLDYFGKVSGLIKSQRPDWILGFSDTWYGIAAVVLGAKYGVKSLVDAYDNYESYIPWAKPLHWLWRGALRKATALTAAGPQLAELMSRGREHDAAVVVPMAADPHFQPETSGNSRAAFSLPDKVPIIGYCGSLYKNRGVESLFKAMELFLQRDARALLVISGRKEAALEIPENIRHAVIHLGYIADEQMPVLINAVDVLAVFNLDSAFGTFSYPVKLYEAMQCRKPVVATRAAGTRWILRNYSECLIDINDHLAIAERFTDALAWKTKDYSPFENWENSAKILSAYLRSK